MAKVTMSLYEALTRKKNYQDRLDKFDIGKKALFGYYTNHNKTINGTTIEDAERVMRSNFDSFIHLNKNIQSLTIAINKANLENTIVIPGYNNNEPVTLTQAITEKQNLNNRNRIINIIANKLEQAMKFVEDTNAKVLNPQNVFDQVSKLEVKDKKSEDTADTYDKLIASFREEYTTHLSDPNKILESGWVEKQRKEMDDFAANMHTALTKANTEIMIEVELED